MRIAQVVPVYPPYRGGMGQVAFEYTGRLSAMGHDVEVFTPGYQPVVGDPGHVHRLAGWPRVGNAAFLAGLGRRVEGFDVVHLHYPFFGAELLGLGQRGRRPPLVLSYYMDATAEGIKGAVFRVHRRAFLGPIVSRAARVLVSSRDYAEHSSLAGLPGVLDRAEVHGFGVDLTRFRPGDGSARRRSLGIDGRHVVVLFVGGLDRAHAFKGVPTLIEALASVGDRPWRAVFVGEGGERTRYARLAAAAGLGERALFVGGVAADDLADYYRMADVHVLPSTSGAEAFGLVTLEAAATGLPSIVSDLPGVRTLVAAGETGLVVPPGDADALAAAIRMLADGPDRRRLMGEAARRRAECTGDWDPLIRRLAETYRAVSAA